MKKILVPTDFSANAETALYYAMALAQKTNASITLLNVIYLDPATSGTVNDLIVKKIFRSKEESLSKLKALELKIKHAGNIKYDSMIVEDFPDDAILQTITNKNIDLVIMGTKGESNLASIIFGSHTAKIIEKATCPVLAIPSGTVFKEFKKITYATNYNQSDIRGLQKLVEMAEPFNAQINVLHIANEKLTPEEEKEMMEQFMEIVNQKISYSNMSYQIMSGESIDETLDEFIENESADLLVMSAHHRDFFDKLFGTSVTKHMAYSASIPLMVFHYKNASVKIYG